MTESTPTRNRTAAGRAKARTAMALGFLVAGMVGLSFASVPLYRLFCQVTGYGGTPQVAEAGTSHVTAETAGKTIKVRFDANVAGGLEWSFRPDLTRMEVPLGESNLAFFRAENRGGDAVVGTATFNISPFKAASYFVKTQCFCFDEQKLAAGESAEMPVSFYVDPEILTDPNTRDLTEITLSYTFFPAATGGQVSRNAGNQSPKS